MPPWNDVYSLVLFLAFFYAHKTLWDRVCLAEGRERLVCPVLGVNYEAGILTSFSDIFPENETWQSKIIER